MATYQIETENGTYEIETDEGQEPKKSLMDSAIEGGKTVSGKAFNIMTGQTDPQQEAMNLSNKGFDMAGELAAEKIGEAGHPIVGGMVGGAIANANNIAGAAALLQNRQALTQGVKAVGSGLKAGVKGVGRGLKKATDFILGPGEDSARKSAVDSIKMLENKLLDQRGALGQIPVKQAERQAALQAEKQGYGQAITKAEELAGVEMKETPDDFIQVLKNPKALNQMSKTLRKIGDTPSDELARTMDKGSLQSVRKFAQTFREVGPEATNTIKANISMGGHRATEALKKIEPVLGSAINEWEKVAKKLERLPLDKMKQQAAVKQAMLNTRFAIKKTQRLNQELIKAGMKRDQVRKLFTMAIPGGAALWAATKVF
jgi:hypothetical protein